MSEDNTSAGFSDPPEEDAGDRVTERERHHALNNPVDSPDPTEWPDPYDHRPDPRDPEAEDATRPGAAPHTVPGSVSTSEPHPKQDPEAEPWAEGPKRDKVDR